MRTTYKLSPEAFAKTLVTPFPRTESRNIVRLRGDDWLHVLARWMHNPWSLYYLVAGNTSWDFRPSPTVDAFRQDIGFVELERLIWRAAMLDQPNNLFHWLIGTPVLRGKVIEQITDAVEDIAIVPEWAAHYERLIMKSERAASIACRLEAISKIPARDKFDINTYKNTGNWQMVRLAAILYSGIQCRVCRTDEELVGHHVGLESYANIGNELPTDITIMCNEHHSLFHADENEQKRRGFGRYRKYG